MSDELKLAEPVTKNLVHLFKLLSDETRLRILHYLLHRKELNVRTLCELLAQSQPAVSHHLALLRVAGLIDLRRDGKHNFYSILPQRFEELMGLFFAALPGKEGKIDFDKYQLRFALINGEASDG